MDTHSVRSNPPLLREQREPFGGNPPDPLCSCRRAMGPVVILGGHCGRILRVSILDGHFPDALGSGKVCCCGQSGRSQCPPKRGTIPKMRRRVFRRFMFSRADRAPPSPGSYAKREQPFVPSDGVSVKPRSPADTVQSFCGGLFLYGEGTLFAEVFLSTDFWGDPKAKRGRGATALGEAPP